MSSPQQLPPKEQAVFRRIMKATENRQYRAALKMCKQILDKKKFSNHGGTLAMKGLVLNHLGKMTEALEVVKEGIKNNFSSTLCWHAYGVVLRSNRMYDDALKALKTALSREKDNVNVLRDLVLLQIYMRDFEGYKETRYAMLKLRPQRNFWMGYINACHLAKDYDHALSVMREFMATEYEQRDDRVTNFNDKCERSELVMYEVSILSEALRFNEALNTLEENAAVILDVVAYLECRATLLMKLGRSAEAAKVWEQLVRRNPDYLVYYENIIACDDSFTFDDKEKLVAFFDRMAMKNPRSRTPVEQAMYASAGEDLRSRLHEYIAHGLRKGVPSLFKGLRPIYAIGGATIIGEILEHMANRLCACKSLTAVSGVREHDDGFCESPTVTLWFLYLAAQHARQIDRCQTALDFINAAINHTPTVPELLLFRAKIYKHVGDFHRAAQDAYAAQLLEMSDRFINSKCAKYFLAIGQINVAQKIMEPFCAEKFSVDVSLNEMQGLWYQLEMAKAYRVCGKDGEALKKCHQIELHMQTMIEDQTDFHQFCFRKLTLRNYTEFLNFLEKIYDNAWYCGAAKIAAEVYLNIYDKRVNNCFGKLFNPSVHEFQIQDIGGSAQKPPEVKTKAPRNENGIMAVGTSLDVNALMRPKDALSEATRFLLPALGASHADAELYFLSFEVFARKNLPLRMMQCAKYAKRIGSDVPYCHVVLTKFLRYFQSYHISDDNAADELLLELVQETYGSERDAAAYNEAYSRRFPSHFSAQLAVVMCAISIDPASAVEAKERVKSLVLCKDINGLDVNAARKMLYHAAIGWLGQWKEDELMELSRACSLRYPLCSSFCRDPRLRSTAV